MKESADTCDVSAIKKKEVICNERNAYKPSVELSR